ncbi:anaerobic ribonucleoside-triphosphate reductase [Ruminococcus sp.]|uniref:anaerobic ribonucleoside-triphosphate reductase n=1 Tax=Ruminococcus sp. TaxID=41978 RepID=UPI0025DBC00A|nr:anaerobic ribonucleoside-triphosphate reductase [Ruminococcus sp.]
MKITVINGEMSQQEIKEYLYQLHKKHPDRIIKEIAFTVSGNYVDIRYIYDTVRFERIRRITGYLVGNLDRFNDAKRTEESERIKHEI